MPPNADRPPMRIGRIFVALVGLVLGLFLLNAGLNMIGEDNAPKIAPREGTPGTTIAPGSTPPGAGVGTTPR